MFGLGLHFTLLLWMGGTSSTQGEVLASAAEIAEAGRPLLLGCNVSTTTSDTVHQVRWLDKDNKLLLAYQPGASIRVSHQDSNVQLVSWQKNSSSITILEVRLEHDGCFRCIFDVFPAGSQEGITCVSVIARVHPDANKMAVSGELATLSCRYGLPERVHQVLWKKKIEQGTITVASYSRVHYHVEEALRSRMNLSKSLSDTKLVFQPVTIEDEACYTCEFHTFPDGTRTGSTCLSVYVLPEVKVTHATSPSGVTTAKCTAGSRPAAEITWSIGGYNQSLNTSLLFLNADGITTVTSTLLLSSGQLTERSIQCIVHHQGLDKPLSVSLSNLSAVSPFIVNIILACGLPAFLILIGLFVYLRLHRETGSVRERILAFLFANEAMGQLPSFPCINGSVSERVASPSCRELWKPACRLTICQGKKEPPLLLCAFSPS